jgi:hypothetical protein
MNLEPVPSHCPLALFQVFEERVLSRNPGEVQPTHAGFEDLVMEEDSKDHFTYCIVEVSLL